jgi:soluble lytic murein transglycosylase
VFHATFRGALVLSGIAGLLVFSDPAAPRAEQSLAPTIHPPVARDAGTLWMVPSDADRSAAAANPALGHFQAALKLYDDEKYDLALARFTSASAPNSPLRGHAAYYAGVSELRLKRFDAARKRFADLKDAAGFLSQAAALGEAEAAQGLGDYGAATTIYERLLKGKSIDEPAVLLSLATAAAAGDDRKRAAEAYLRLYYEHPFSEFAAQAEGPLQSMVTAGDVQAIEAGNLRYRLELGRAERLFGARRRADARVSYLRLKPHAAGDDAELVDIRLAEIDYFGGRHRIAREALAPYVNKGSRQAEARFYYAMAQRGLKDNASFVSLARALATDFSDTSWGEEALNNLATYYIQEDADEDADAVLRDLLARFPRGRYSERAAWKVGWKAYRAGNSGEAARYFEAGATNFPRSDYRPAWLFWSGRARNATGDRVAAVSRYRLAVSDYQNTYYGRLAARELAQLGEAPQSRLVFARSIAEMGGEGDHFPASAGTIRTLLALNLYAPALEELEFARKTWGDTPVVGATIAWVNLQRSAGEKGMDRLMMARGAMNQMKRAYPQFMAAGGEQLPRDILTTIFPLSYWDLIKQYSAERDLDPYLMAALVAQESTFVPDVRSHANAYGLMQLLPSTARSYARKLNLRYSSRLLTTAEPNVRIGTAYFADKIREFGSIPLALASYNAGETAVRRWIAERDADLSQEEFIDDIPYPETQNYVKRILGTAEDYRRLYGPK